MKIEDSLGKAHCYTIVDSASGFHQMPLREKMAKIVFSTPGRHFE
jgi:hypothetical protein